ncbi:ribonuclease H-like domain-containing protein [Cladorrhinum sp. PSN259]|nr:ribonuclease H-like domain-containing protein [Cladorrhinum sp. PSN259]
MVSLVASGPPIFEVTDKNFWRVLPEINKTIGVAEYVTYDLELTGIRGERIKIAPKSRIDQAYQLVRSAAQTFQILQMGITCVWYSTYFKNYRSQTFSIHLTPFFTKATNDLANFIDGKLTLSYKSFLFLEQHDFSFRKAFADGVPYLSRAEHRKEHVEYLEKEYHPLGRKVLVDLENDTCKQARAMISAWLKSNPGKGDSTAINFPRATQQVRLSLQNALRFLVETEFPQCRLTFLKGQEQVFVSIWAEEKRKEWVEQQSVRVAAVAKQTGKYYCTRKGASLSHIFELLLGEKNHLQRPPIIVGHNQWFDLCFLYQTFVGELPTRFEEFRKEAKVIWPQLVDTNYMSIDTGNDPENLSNLYKRLAGQKDPFTLVWRPNPSFGKKDTTRPREHDAGYDSWMTAMVFGNLVKQVVNKQDSGDKLSAVSPIKNTETSDPFSKVNPFPPKREISTSTVTTATQIDSGSARSECFIPPWLGRDGNIEAIWKQYGSKVRFGSAGVLDLSRSEVEREDTNHRREE